VIGFGLGRLGLAPAAFWAMTPRELAAVLRLFAAPEATADPRALAALMARFPDAANPRATRPTFDEEP
jgi:uncharacterized phage protein (TIGR02216 family)